MENSKTKKKCIKNHAAATSVWDGGVAWIMILSGFGNIRNSNGLAGIFMGDFRFLATSLLVDVVL